jgi:hypothetical protein
MRAVGRPDGETEDRRGSRIGREEGGRYLGIPQNPGQPAHQPVIINPVSTKPGAVHDDTRLLAVEELRRPKRFDTGESAHLTSARHS